MPEIKLNTDFKKDIKKARSLPGCKKVRFYFLMNFRFEVVPLSSMEII
jgi:hypothetical protein